MPKFWSRPLEEHLLGMVVCGNPDAVCRILQRGANLNCMSMCSVLPLFIAVKKGSLDCVKVLLEHGADPNGKAKPYDDDIYSRETRDSIECLKEWSPLLLAAFQNFSECVELLIKFGADLNYRDSSEMSALTCAIMAKSTSCIKILLRKGCTVTCVEKVAIESRNKLNFQEMYIASQKPEPREQKHIPKFLAAAMEGDCVALTILLQNHVDVNQRDLCDDTALHMASRNGHRNCINVLLEYNANVNCQNMLGLSPLHLMAQCGHVNLMALILEKNAIVDINDNEGLTPLHIASRVGNMECVKLLVEHGACINKEDNDTLTPLHFAMSSLNKDCIKLLVKKGADVFAQSRHSYIPLSFAAVEGVEYFKLLMPKDVNKKCVHGMTPLYIACICSAECVKFVLEKGAHVNAKSSSGNTPLHACVFGQNLESMEMLLDYGAEVFRENWNYVSPLELTTLNGDVESFKVLFKKINSYSRGRHGMTALHIAAANNLECLEVVLGSEVNVNVKNKDGFTALHFTAEEGKESAMKILLEHGANANLSDNIKFTPLHKSASNGLTDCVKLLVKYGANVNALSRNKCTPLHLAAEGGHLDCIRILLENGADINLPDFKHATALMNAAKNAHFESVRLLLEHDGSLWSLQ